jgi:hypothetical protein
MNKRISYIILSVAFLLIGVIVYYYCRNEVLIYESYLGINKSKGIVGDQKLVNANWSNNNIANWLSKSIANWLPDLCWEISFLYMLTAVWGSWKQIPILLKLATLIVILGSELLQAIGIIPGTGDILDILVYFIGFTIFTLVYSNKLRKNK